MRLLRIAGLLILVPIIGCAHMDFTNGNIEPSASQLEELAQLVRRIVAQPPRSCDELGLGQSTGFACALPVALANSIQIEPVVGGVRLDVVVSIAHQYCVTPAVVIEQLPRDWAFEFSHGGGGPSDSDDIAVTEIYDSVVLNERIVMELNPNTDPMCLRSFRVIHWGRTEER